LLAGVVVVVVVWCWLLLLCGAGCCLLYSVLQAGFRVNKSYTIEYVLVGLLEFGIITKFTLVRGRVIQRSNLSPPMGGSDVKQLVKLVNRSSSCPMRVWCLVCGRTSSNNFSGSNTR